MKRVGIYVRMSKDAAHSGAGVARQERECQELVDRHSDWTVERVYSDNDLSAFSGAPRKDYEALLADIEAGQIDLVVCWHTDRLYRRMADLERYIAVCNPAKVPTHAVQAGPLDLTTPSGRMVARTLGAVAQYESEQKGARHRLANQQRVRQGKVQRTRRCFGYELDGQLRKEEADAVRQAAERILNGGSLAEVARQWNEKELFPPQGKRRTEEEKKAYAEAVEAAQAAGEDPPEPPPLRPSEWVSSSVRLTLRAPRIAGMTTYKGEIVRDETTGEPVQAKWPEVLDQDTWHALQARLDVIQAEHRFPSAGRQLLSGLAQCAECGSPLISGGTRNGKRRYRCRAVGGHVYREAAPIDQVVERIILARLSRPDVLELVAPAMPETDVATIRGELADLDARQAELGAAYADGVVKLVQLTAANKRMDALRADLERQLPKPSSPAVASILRADDVASAWAELDQDSKRAIIDALCIVKVRGARTKEKAYLDWKNRVINPDTVEFTWRQDGPDPAQGQPAGSWP